ncbi:MAG: hypothetical protein Ct9H300mP30_1310 [Methanobacteriota archaeon]|nr:MAG: hypothetical protein Ct9H300mP30_1310 [Euryarchaeota archaeon]
MHGRGNSGGGLQPLQVALSHPPGLQRPAPVWQAPLPSIRKRTSKELRQQLRLPKDARHEDGSPYRILVAISGGKDSAVLLTMMHDILAPAAMSSCLGLH